MNDGRIMNQCSIKYGWMMYDGWKIDGLWINDGWMMDEWWMKYLLMVNE
jgi:hypothetical protein